LKKFNPYRNIFYYYKGSTDKQQQRDKQIEDNTTKALINTLEYSSDSLLGYLLAEIGIPCTTKSKPQFDLQTAEEFSRPDALINLGKTNIFIECKVAAPINKKQIKNHLRSIGKAHLVCITPREDDRKILDSIRDSRIRFITWQKIYETFCQYLLQYEYNENLIVQQFNKYLENINMTSFNGFQKEDFDSFLYIEDDPKKELRLIVKNKLMLFLGELQKRTQNISAFKNLEIDIGNLKKDDKLIWGSLSKPPLNNKVQIPHYNFVLNRNRFSIGVIVEGKKPAKQLQKNIQSDVKSFYKILRQLDKYTFEVHHKVNINNQPRKFRHYSVASLKCGNEISLEDVYYLINKANQYNLFVFVCYLFVPRDSIELGSKGFVNEAIKYVKRLKPLYEFAWQGLK